MPKSHTRRGYLGTLLGERVPVDQSFADLGVRDAVISRKRGEPVSPRNQVMRTSVAALRNLARRHGAAPRSSTQICRQIYLGVRDARRQVTTHLAAPWLRLNG